MNPREATIDNQAFSSTLYTLRKSPHSAKVINAKATKKTNIKDILNGYKNNPTKPAKANEIIATASPDSSACICLLALKTPQMNDQTKNKNANTPTNPPCTIMFNASDVPSANFTLDKVVSAKLLAPYLSK